MSLTDGGTDRLVVGLAGAVFPNFAAEELGVYPRSVEIMTQLAKRWGFDLVPVTHGLESAEDARRQFTRFERQALILSYCRTARSRLEI